MKNKSQKENSYFFNKFFWREFFWTAWLEYRLLEIFDLLKMIHLRAPLKIIRVQILRFLIYSLIYPAARIILKETKAQTICHSFLNNCFPLTLTHFPFFKGKIILPDLPAFRAYTEIYISNIYFWETLKKGMNVIDVGAHIGLYTLLSTKEVGDTGKVIAIEPETKNYRNLKKNIRLNNCKNVICKNMALTNREGMEKLYLNPYNSLSHSLIFQTDKNFFIRVIVKTLDKLVQELNLKKIDVIKIDAEGAEIPILEGAENTLRNNPHVKMLIACYHYPSQVKEVETFLYKRNFRPKISYRGIITTNI